MIALQAVWADATLHLWGEHVFPQATESTDEPAQETGGGCGPAKLAVVSHDELRGSLGDLWDSLLIFGAGETHLSLDLPHLDLDPVSLFEAVPEGAVLRTFDVPTLTFGPADAVDLLAAAPVLPREDLMAGDSLRYWCRVAQLALELLGKQRFVPAVHAGGGQYRGYWRVVVDDAETSERLRALIVSMPPVCRSFPVDDTPVQASTLVENFLWTAVDALVRRCLEGDELAHALQDRSDEARTSEIRWLRALVRADPVMEGTPEECRTVVLAVQSWLAGLESPPDELRCRTCFRLYRESPAAANEDTDPERPWRLTLHVQATEDSRQILEAARLWDEDHKGPAILKRPFARAREQLRADLARAARHFTPLEPCAEPDGPLQCRLTLEETYLFLRDAAPVLRAEGFGVWVPQWWHEDRPRLRMQLDIRPLGDSAAAVSSNIGLDALISYDWRVALGEEELSLDELRSLSETKAPLVRLRGHWTEVQAADVQAALRFLDNHQSGRMTVFEALRLSYAADDLDTGLTVGGLNAHGWIERLLNASQMEEHLEHIPPPTEFHGTLRPYQLSGLQWMSFLGRHGLGACLADDMGLGKTIQMIALWLHEREEGDPPGPTLLVVPMSLVGNWQREIARFAPSLKVMVHHGLERLTGDDFAAEARRHDVVISTYGLAHRDLQHLARVDWHRLALDEAQNIKNSAAKQAMAVRALNSITRVAITGTPLENHLSELWSIMDFLNPGYLGTASDFRRRFAVPVERHHDEDRARRLRHLIRPLVLRRVKDDPKVAVDLRRSSR